MPSSFIPRCPRQFLGPVATKCGFRGDSSMRGNVERTVSSLPWADRLRSGSLGRKCDNEYCHCLTGSRRRTRIGQRRKNACQCLRDLESSCRSQTAVTRRRFTTEGTEEHSMIPKNGGMWQARESSYVPTPLSLHSNLQWVSEKGMVIVMDCKSGDLVTRRRLNGLASGGRAIYASPVLSGKHIYVVTRRNGT